MVARDKDGKIYFFVRYTDLKGNIKQKRTYNNNWKTLKEAKEAEQEFLRTIGEKPEKSIKNYGNLYKLYLKHRSTLDKLSTMESTQDLHRSHILPTFEQVKIEAITPAKIEAWQERLNKSGYKNSYLKQIQSHFKRVLQFGKVYDHIPQNPFYRPFVKRKETTVKIMNYYTLDEFNLFVSVIDDVLDKAIFETLYWSGLRKSELLALKVKDIDFEKKVIHVTKTYDQRHRKETTPKNRNGFRDIIMTDRVIIAIQVQLKEYEHIYGFDKETYVFGFHIPISYSTIDRRNREYAAKAKLKRIRIHDFRHSHASFLINQGFNQFEIAKRLGHTVQELTETYGHWFVESQHNMIDKINKFEVKTQEKPIKNAKITA